MFIKKTAKRVKGKTYVNHLLVESVATPNGPRHKVLCSLGSLAPAPKKDWLALARRVDAALSGQEALWDDGQADSVATQVRSRRRRGSEPPLERDQADVVAIHTDRVTTEEHREAGPVHVGHQMWKRLSLDAILSEAGLTGQARRLTEVMALNRLVDPLSEHAMPDWIRRTAMADVLGLDFKTLTDEALYRNLDKLHPQRVIIEQKLAAREKTLFSLDDSLYLYDLTSTYFEGQCALNPQAKRGYSRDQRPDCKQVVVGLVLDRDGFPKAHEVFDGNRVDRTTLGDMLTSLEKRTGQKGGATVVVDRGMAFADNLKEIKDRGYHYIVAARQGGRDVHLSAFEDEEGWEEIIRQPSPRNPAQKKSRVFVKQRVVGEEVHVLCRSEGRENKDRAIREKHEARLLGDLTKLQARVSRGRLRDEGKIHQAIGRLRERHSRVGRYYLITYDSSTRSLAWREDPVKKEKAIELDGTYLLKTDRHDLAQEEIWRIYILLTRAEAAFRSMKSPLLERPIFHHLEHRVQTHIFLCVLAYHLLVAIEKMFLDRGVHTSWWTLRQQLSTHEVSTIVLPAADGRTLRIRKGSTPEPSHAEIYRILHVPQQVMKPVKIWTGSKPPIVTENGHA
jgi:transposase